MKFIISVTLLCLSLSVFSQMRSREQYSKYDDYMHRSQRKKTAGIVFLSVGSAVTIGGAALIIDGANRHKRETNNGGYYGGDITDGEVEEVVGVLASVVGVGFMCGSIPFFVGAHRSRVKALSYALKTERLPKLYTPNVSGQWYPALAFKIQLGR